MSDPRDYQRIEASKEALAELPSYERTNVLRNDSEVAELIDAAQDMTTALEGLGLVLDLTQEFVDKINRLQSAADAFSDG